MDHCPKLARPHYDLKKANLITGGREKLFKNLKSFVEMSFFDKTAMTKVPSHTPPSESDSKQIDRFRESHQTNSQAESV